MGTSCGKKLCCGTHVNGYFSMHTMHPSIGDTNNKG